MDNSCHPPVLMTKDHYITLLTMFAEAKNYRPDMTVVEKVIADHVVTSCQRILKDFFYGGLSRRTEKVGSIETAPHGQEIVTKIERLWKKFQTGSRNSSAEKAQSFLFWSVDLIPDYEVLNHKYVPMLSESFLMRLELACNQLGIADEPTTEKYAHFRERFSKME